MTHIRTSRNAVPTQLFIGMHCETTATGSLLYRQGLCLTEAMMFGLGEGLGFVFLNLSSLGLPFIGGRSKPFEMTESLCRNLGARLDAQETSSKAKAWERLVESLNEKQCVGLQLDSYFLDYFSSKTHFGGHCVAAYGIEGDDVLIVDTRQQGGRQRVSKASLEKARFAKGPMTAKARAWTVSRVDPQVSLVKPIRKAINSNARTYLKPAFKGMSHLGIEKLASSLPKWLDLAKDPPKDLALSSLLMERAGTGGGLFRCFYRDFLKESAELLDNKALRRCSTDFAGIAEDWQEVARLIGSAGETGTPEPLMDASRICGTLATREKEVMSALAEF